MTGPAPQYLAPAVVPTGSGSQPAVPRWLATGSLALTLLGLAAAGYLTFEHYTASTSLACPESGAVNCVKVTTSSYSTVAGIPVALLGLLYFAAMTALCSPTTWQDRHHRSIPAARLLAASAGVVFVIYLLWAELFRINAICLWCTGVHAVTLALFTVVTVGHALRPRDTG